MTSRERVYLAFAHREPDAVPVRVYDPIQQLAAVDEDVLERFGADTLELGSGFGPVEAGLDATNPVQISTSGMEAEVQAHVRRQVRAFAPGGGFVFQQVHKILAGVPPANIVAMFDAIRA
jgi:hypothetical protein